MKRLLWIGSFVTDEIAMDLFKEGYHNSASIVSQTNILDGIESVTGLVFDTINAVAMKGFPNQKTLWVRQRYFSHAGNASDELVGYLNLQYLNRVTSRCSLTTAARKWVNSNTPDEVDIFVYEMRSACLAAANEVKKHVPKARIHLIVPDLPQFMDLSMRKLKTALKRIDWEVIARQLEQVDDYILYAEPMADFLNIRDKKWMVMEGSIHNLEISKQEEKHEIYKKPTQKTVVMYSGSVQLGFKIENLLEAMAYLDDSFELWITGGGTAVKIVEEYSARDNRIKYYGYLPTREALRALQNQADMMINMRDPVAPGSIYCFPSKLFEYLLLGKPVLSCHLRGIPEEYYPFLVKIESLEPQDIANAIRNADAMCNKSDFGQMARKFIIERKNHIAQAERIVSFVEER